MKRHPVKRKSSGNKEVTAFIISHISVNERTGKRQETGRKRVDMHCV